MAAVVTVRDTLKDLRKLKRELLEIKLTPRSKLNPHDRPETCRALLVWWCGERSRAQRAYKVAVSTRSKENAQQRLNHAEDQIAYYTLELLSE